MGEGKISKSLGITKTNFFFKKRIDSIADGGRWNKGVRVVWESESRKSIGKREGKFTHLHKGCYGGRVAWWDEGRKENKNGGKRFSPKKSPRIRTPKNIDI